MLSQFLYQYPVSKTIRFSLIPVGKTQEYLEPFIKDIQSQSILSKDVERFNSYMKFKRILDDYYRDFIEIVLQNNIVKESDLLDAYNKRMDDNEYDKITKSLRESISKNFNLEMKNYGLDKYSTLLKSKKGSKSQFEYWLEHKKEVGDYSIEQFEEANKLTELYSNFLTYFAGFKENRNNLFVADDKHTSIANRIINENMSRYFDNVQNYNYIKMKYPELHKKIETYNQFFLPERYGAFFSQKGIDDYNVAIGHKSEGMYEKGINQLINEYKQKNKAKIPSMKTLYKQHLSLNNQVYIETIENNKQLLEMIKEADDFINWDDIGRRICTIFKEHLISDYTNIIYIKNQNINNLSKELYDDWGIIAKCLNDHAEAKISNKSKREHFLKKPVYSINELQSILDEQLNDSELNNKTIANYYSEYDFMSMVELVSKSSKKVKSLNEDSNKKELTSAIKEYLDAIKKLQYTIKVFILEHNGKKISIKEKNDVFYGELENIYHQLDMFTPIYNKARNFLTKKPYSTEKMKIMFNNVTLLSGWDKNKEKDSLCLLLRKDNYYYLGIMAKEHRNIFDETRVDIPKLSESEAYYEKMEYKQISGASKMLPKVFFAASNRKIYQPSDRIMQIREQGLQKKEANDRQALNEWIDFCKDCIAKHPEWNDYFTFSFKTTEDYINLSDFYKDVDNCTYSLRFKKISEKYIDEKVTAGEMYLFKIYNKDFSPHSKGRPNLHTMYWRALFSEENLNNIKDPAKPIIALNGGAEIFYRPKSLTRKVTHEKGVAINNKNSHNPKRESVFDYDLIKDKRYTEHKFLFHCPITLNYRADITRRFNEKVNSILEGNKDIRIIGIDRGERHLLYYSLIDYEGNILEQGSLNELVSQYNSSGKTINIKTDYHSLLNKREKERAKSRENWGVIENIKELKSGYLSQVVHALVKMIIENNAIVVMENLNIQFKRLRFGVEKQVYQKFEKALIDKLNYLAFKDREIGQEGSVLNAYQLTEKFTSFKKMGAQTGIIYYVPASYTSKICPKTGFVNLLYPKYINLKKAQNFWSAFDKVCYNKTENYFEFSFDYTKFTDKSGKKTKWTACSYGEKRYYYNNKTKETNCYNVTELLKSLFESYSIDWYSGNCLKKNIVSCNEVGFHKSLMFYLKLILTLRHTNSNTNEDLIISPIKSEDGTFFHSDKAGDDMPIDSDANGAYHIARKGLLMINRIKDGRVNKMPTAKDWFDYVQ